MSIIQTIKFVVNHPLNKHNKVESIVRYLKWQIGSRLIPGDVVFDWINGSKVLARNGDTGITGNIYCGLHEFSDMAFLLHLLREDDFFVDIGANVGSYTILASSVAKASTCCYEPVPSTFSKLEFNIKLNGLEEKVTLMNIGLGNKVGEIQFSSDQDTMNHVIAANEYNENNVVVPVSTLDETLNNIPLLMKIDVEGYETPVLEGAVELLKNEDLCAIIMEINRSGDRYGFDEKEMLQLMFGYGFRTYSYSPFQRVLHDLQGGISSEGNTLFIRNKDFVSDRVSKGPLIEINGISI